MQRALVLGLGVSGKAAVELLLAQGYQVSGADDKAGPEQLKDLISRGMYLQSNLEAIDWSQINLFVVSPGISPQHPLYRAALLHQIEIIGEAELSFRNLSQPAVAITGTNGKTTVTLLVEHILNASGVKAKALGNVGSPLSVYALNPDPGCVIVAELSSYQLETMTTPVFDAAVILNITPDHLDRYSSMEEYARAKCRLQNLLKPSSPFFVSKQVACQFAPLLKPGHIVYTQSESVEEILPPEYRELGEHDIENAMAAWVLCKPFKITAEQFRNGLNTFTKPHHRIEFVATIDGVHFFDDSKGTNIDAVIRAVQTMKGPVILIAGGVDKGSSYLAWKEVFRGKVKRIIAIGQAAPKIFQELNPFFEMEIVDSLSAAVKASAGHAVKGDHVLLSPGCSSFDMFRDYAHRGEEFQRTVLSLRRGG
ncbi:MAG: UDP-N-acetylmuramoyl-L-alanine--D-glutamate ligase [Verrucomicrobia bacterium]|nr:UDP-N-acetylmuramoyl-L-alanine--D-glutamate ligase [Verrucomicrobiota bacterium]